MKRQNRLTKGAALTASATTTAGGVVWYMWLMRGVWAAEALGPICRHGGLLVLHCPACYAALAVAGLGTASIALSASPAKALIKR